ncbi:hypothetical protein F5148DRAFT_1154764 [Russula earlei]|uniref:Uncharacterized protein n=1 Tax=Russula earlei TaxID=71964 RepID=A0ACC0TR15_9AGAM|nr:hypothetical protein F5148DRAFT_1154764 [Russula earlei]
METWELRKAAHTVELLSQARQINCTNELFMTLMLHSNNSGLFGHHLWSGFKALIMRCGHAHTKYEDLSKLVVFIVHNIIPWNNKEGWSLLPCLQSFAILDLNLGFEVHTEQTIAASKCALKSFAQRMKEYAKLSTDAAILWGESIKNWNFPKMHALVHSFDDIECEGASRNYNTKPNEKLHGPLKRSYMHSNFKDVANQLLRNEHHCFVLSLMHGQLDEIDETRGDNLVDLDKAPEDLPSDPSQNCVHGQYNGPELHGKLLFDGHIILHSQQLMVTLGSIGDSLHEQLSNWLCLQAVYLQIPSSYAMINLDPDHPVRNALASLSCGS